jgi:filamentous hemagglutinin family protein
MRRALGWLPTVVGLALAAAGSATAQIATDGTVGARLELSGPDYDIHDGFGRRAGLNLFHSFKRFSLRSGTSATFSGPAEIRNVISRVTGGERSRINGTITSTMPNTNFFFLNPAGVVFGPNARLDVKGSFHVSTADELHFANGERFSARLGGANSFSVASPEAFGFLGADPAPITVNESRLQVLPGEALSIVGGDIGISGGLPDPIRAEAGRITLSALGGPGEAQLGNGDVVADRLADITLRDHSRLSTTGDGGGTIRIRAGRFLLTDASSLSANNNGSSDSRGGIDIESGRVEMTGGAFISASALGGGNAGTVTVEADQITVDSAGSGGVTGIFSDVRQGATGRGGVVIVSATDFEIRDGGEIRSSTFGNANAGAVEVGVRGRLLISGEGLEGFRLTGISSSVEPNSTGEGGTVTVTADEVDLRADGAIRSVTFSQGKGGTVRVTADRVTLRSGGQISSSTLEEGTGESGDVVLTAHEALSVSGQSRFFDEDGGVFPPSGVFASTESRRPDARAGGTVRVSSPVIRLADRGEIASESFGGGAGGNVRVTTESLEIDNAEITTKAEGAGDGGRIRVAADVLELRNHGLITAQSTGAGAAGAVTVEVGDRLLLFEGSEVSTDSAEAGGGRIQLLVGDTIVLRDSQVITSVAGGEDPTAGNVLIDPKVLVIDGSKIQANAPRGFGGDITIVADNALVPGNDVQALLDRKDISATGEIDDGRVTVTAPELDLSRGLVVLEGAVLDVSELRERCAARRDVGASSFTGVGRGGLPPGPDGPLAGGYLGRDAPGGAAPGPAADARPEPASSPPPRAWAIAAVAPCVGWPETATSSP